MHQLPEDIHSRYEVLEKLGEGGMGLVFKVRHRLLGELRVVKVIRAHHAEDEAVRERFRREARAAIRLRHPNIAQIQDFHIGDDGRAYLVMELIEGLTFKQLIAQSRLPPVNLALGLGLQGLDALGYLHDQGYLHRDVAPDNLMLTRGYDGQPRVKLIDLGLAKRQAETVELTATNMFVGKVRYASPELFRRPLADPNPASDLYSFGVLLYELLTGICPIQGSSFEELMASHLLDEPIPFVKTDPDGRLNEDLRGTLLKALAKKPEDRFGSALDFGAALRRHHSPDPTAMGQLESLYGRKWSQPSASERGPVSTDSTTVAAGMGEGDVRAAVADDSTGSQNENTFLVDPAKRKAKKRKRDRPEDDDTAPPGRADRPRFRPGWIVPSLVTLVAATFAVFGAMDLSLDDLVDRFTPREPQTTVDTGNGAESPLPATGFGQGRLVISALPWAEIVTVIDQSGRSVPLSGPLYTPTLLSLPAGTYRIELTNPASPDSRTIEVQVPITGTERRSVDFGASSSETYFADAGLGDWLEGAGAEAPSQ